MSYENILLANIPDMGRLYARGARRSASLIRDLKKGKEVGALPKTAHLARGVKLDPTNLTAYQHLLGEPGLDVAPAGFVHVTAFPLATSVMVRDDFPLPLIGMVHISNRVEQFAPVSIHDEFLVRSWAENLRAHRRGALVDMISEVTVSDEVVWRGTSTYLAKDVDVPDSAESANGDARPSFDDLPTTAGRWKLPADIGRTYGKISGDRNPIHQSAITAKPLGFPRAIAHGMYTAARALAVIGQERGDRFTWSVNFAKPVFIPGTVTFGTERLADNNGWRYAGWEPKKGKVHFTGEVVRN